MSKQKMTRKDFFKELRVLFLGWELFFVLLFLYGINAGFFYLVTKSIAFSLIFGFVGMIFFFYVFIFPNRKLKKYQFHLNELLKYVTNLTFFLQTGNNVPHALESTKKTVDKEIQKDIQKTIDTLEKDAVLDTEHFKKYDFPSLDQYHRNLMIKYDRGGEASELFGQIQRNMIFELKKRDELYKKRKGFALNVYILLGMVGSMMLMLRLVAPYLWDIFLSMSFMSLSIIGVTYVLILTNLYFLQKHNKDISVRL